jgi:serine/threonine protein kinase
MPNLIGKTLGRYHILEQIGEGGMAIVYKAFDTRLESDVAIKVIRTERFKGENIGKALKRFEREAKALAKLSHPNIVNVLDYGEHEGRPYLVMPYLSGGTLKSLLGEKLPYSRAVSLMVSVANALAYAHSHGIVHRDVKPSNILITESGEPTLTDFGVAKILQAEETMDLTATGMGVGTPEYMAPEQGLGKKVDHRADIYALGVILYEMVVGRKPYQADTPMAVLYKQMTDPLPRPSSLVPDLLPEVENILLKSLAKSPENRYKTMKRMAEALSGLNKIFSAKSPGLSKAASSPARKPLKWILGAGVAIGTTLIIWVASTFSLPIAEGPPDTSAPEVAADITIIHPTNAVIHTLTPTFLPATDNIPVTATPTISAPTSTLIPTSMPVSAGEIIRFISFREGYLGIYSIQPDGSDLQLIYEIQEWEYNPQMERANSDSAMWASYNGVLEWSPDGEKLCLENNADRYYVNLERQEHNLIIDKPLDYGCEWSPQSEFIALLSKQEFTSETVVVINPDDGGRTPISFGQYPKWSPDGNLLAYYKVDETGEDVIYTVSYNGKNERRIGTGNDAKWSPDGQYLAAIFGSTRRHSLHLYDVSGSYIGRYAEFGNDWQSNYAWSPDSTQIAYYQDRQNLKVVDIQTGQIDVIISELQHRNEDILWSPDGKRIALSSNDEERPIYLVDIETKTVFETPGENPIWSADSQLIVYEHDNDIYIVDVETSERTQLTSETLFDGVPVWYPARNE